jgi:signal transduction histidine kinase
MEKVAIKKVGIIIFCLIIIRVGVIYSVDLVNNQITDYISLENQSVGVEDIVQGPVKALVLENIDSQEGKTIFYLKGMDKQSLTLIYDETNLPYSIYVNDQLIVQNMDATLGGYSDRISYAIIQIEESDYLEMDKTQVVKIELRRAPNIMNAIFYLGEQEEIYQLREARTICNVILLIGFFVILIVSGFFYYRDQANYMLVILLISIISFFKSIVGGELYALSQWLGINGQNYFFFDSFTSVLNFFLYQTLIYILYKFSIKRVYLYIYMILYFGLSIAYIVDGYMPAYLSILIVGDIVLLILKIIGYVKNKSYSISLLIGYNIFMGLNIFTVLNRINVMKSGTMSSAVFGPKVGSLIYIQFFLIAVIRTYFNNLRDYENKQIEYERVTLLRGIGHDLKLPLSVIRLNNQILQRYKMTSEEGVEHLNSNIEATLELQKMIDNINCYLNMDSPFRGEGKTSIQESFIKLNNLYCNSQNHQKQLTVKWDATDYLLKIEPLEFERMLFNLIDNAFKYNKGNEEIKIEYVIQKNVVITIEDSGIGMNKKDREKIFQPFFKADTSRTKEGFGLGLSVVQGVVNKLEGKIQVESVEGIGTKIIITIPKKI